MQMITTTTTTMGRRWSLILMVMLMILDESGVAQPVSHPVRSPGHPLCMSQFALANHACAFIPYGVGSAPNPYSAALQAVQLPPWNPLSQGQRQRQRHGHADRQSPKKQGHRSPKKGHDEGHGRHRHSKSQKRGERQHHGGHHRGHRQHHLAIEEECCRWVKAIDDRCVCNLLLRMPVFLSRPAHNYTVKVHGECEVEFQCPGRLHT